MKKNVSSPASTAAQVLNIEGATADYRAAAIEKKSCEARLSATSDLIRAYAILHPEDFVDSTLSLPNGISVRRSSRVSTTLERVTPELLLAFLHTASSAALTVKVDHKQLVYNDTEARALLKLMGYQVHHTDVYSVNVTSKGAVS